MSRIRRFCPHSGIQLLRSAPVLCSPSYPCRWLCTFCRSEFGLWAVMTQAISYIALIDAGMTSAVARHLIDHKDNPGGGDYGSVILTGNLVWVIQGAIVFPVGFALGPWLAQLLAIPTNLQHEFIVLIRWQSASWRFGFATRLWSQMMYAHQRSDLANYVAISVLRSICSDCEIRLVWGQGVYSMLWRSASTPSWVNCCCSSFVGNVRCSGLRGGWGRPTWARFNQLFHYGKTSFWSRWVPNLPPPAKQS